MSFSILKRLMAADYQANGPLPTRNEKAAHDRLAGILDASHITYAREVDLGRADPTERHRKADFVLFDSGYAFVIEVKRRCTTAGLRQVIAYARAGEVLHDDRWHPIREATLLAMAPCQGFGGPIDWDGIIIRSLTPLDLLTT
jgi:hypothetical protein